MPALKVKTRIMDEDEHEALTRKIYCEVPPTAQNGRAGTTVFMLDGDFLPTQNMASIRWIMTDSPYDCHLFQVDGAGDAILLKR